MRIIFFFAFLSISTLAQSQTAQAINLLPVPKQMVLQNDSLLLSQKFTVSVDADAKDTLLFKAVNRMYQTLNRRTGLYFEQQYILPVAKNNAATLLIHINKTALPVVGADESYSIKISGTQILLEAPNTTGALHGLETLLQLVVNSNNKFYFPAVVIEDAPRFQWRGLMIDVARHFIPVDVIKRNIEAMAAVKMNVLHLHLSDNEGFRVESKVFPGLQNQGSNGEFYTQAQVKEMIAFAKERGIIIVPEFDLPGHSQSWFAAYPELASAPGPYKPGPPFTLDRSKPLNLGAVMQLMTTAPFPAMDPSKESTYIFLDKFFAEMSALFPAPYMHIGADENNGVVWKNNPAIVAFMKKNDIPDTHALQAYFVRRAEKIIGKYHKQMIGWEELFSKDLSKDVMVQVWQNASYIKRVTEQGNPMLLSKGFYLDIFMPAYIYYNNTDLAAINTANEGNLKGGEAAQWAEAADKNNIENQDLAKSRSYCRASLVTRIYNRCR
jgi:hexosaminidase